MLDNGDIFFMGFAIGMVLITLVMISIHFAASSLVRKKEREQMFIDQLDDKALRLYTGYTNDEIIKRLK